MQLQENDTTLTSVLMIEDCPVYVGLVNSILQHSHHTVTKVGSLATGLLQLANGFFDVVLLDLNLPDSRGLETLVRVRNYAPDSAIVVLTGTDDIDRAAEALQLGAQEYLVKDEVTAKILHRTIRAAFERMKLQRLESERMRMYEQREDFMASLTHDLRNPLIGSIRILELLSQEKMGGLSKQQVEILQALRESHEALLDMIGNFLDAYRHEKDVYCLHLETTDLKELISKHLKKMEPLIAERKIKLDTELSADVGTVLADQYSMTRVVDNLVGNAIKFVPDGGYIGIRLWQENSDKVCFQVSDSGPGIADDERSQLFQRFWRSRRNPLRKHGTGLGLYLCQQIVHAHQGQIWCEPKDTNGATFIVSLPTSAGWTV